MRQRSLTDRLEKSSAEIAAAERARVLQAKPETKQDSQVLAQVAHALTAALSSPPRKAKPAADLHAPEPVDAKASTGFPLMLAGRPNASAHPAEVPVRRTRFEWRQFIAPVLLVTSLIGVALLMSTGFNDAPRPKLTRLPSPDIASTLLATSASEPMLLDQAIASREDLKLLEHCEELIGKGEIRKAREELSRAAANGNTAARFALAETFDPNVLAAWGLREDVADASVARTLYDQALNAGDNRARPRLSALK